MVRAYLQLLQYILPVFASRNTPVYIPINNKIECPDEDEPARVLERTFTELRSFDLLEVAL